MDEKPISLGEALPLEIQRVSELIGIYRSIGPAGNFAIGMMEIAIKKANKAIFENDIPAMMRALEDLGGFEE